MYSVYGIEVLEIDALGIEISTVEAISRIKVYSRVRSSVAPAEVQIDLRMIWFMS